MNIKGRINADAILDDVIGTGPTFFPGLKQAVENAVDAGATEIRIEVVNRGQTSGYICIIDDGHGFRTENFESFCSLRVSSKKGKKGQIGKHGSGRLFLLRFAGSLRVFTKSEEFPKLSTFSFTREDAVALIKSTERSFPREEVRKPTWLALESKTGSALIIECVNWKEVPTIREMIARFAEHLKPSIASIVKINGESLVPRDVVGEVIQQSFQADYLPGVQEVELFIPVERRRGEEIMIGALNQICGMSTFYRQLKPLDAGMVPSSLLDRSVCGAIYIPALNEYRASSAEELESDFYGAKGTDLRLAVLRFMQEEIRPLVEAAFQRKRQRDDAIEQTAFLEGIVDRINPAFDFDPNAVRGGGSDSEDKGPKSRPIREGLQVNTRYLTLTPGDQFTFRITRKSGTSGKFSWDDSGSGGKVVPKSGTEVVYTAGKNLSPEGEPFRLIVWDEKASDLSVTIQIQIVKELPVSITPQFVEVAQGASHVFRLRNSIETSGLVGWRVKGKRLGVSLLRDTGSSTEVMVDEKATLGSYTLVAEDMFENGGTYEASFQVVEATEQKGTYIRIEEAYYLVESAPYIQMVVERVKEGSVITQGGRRKKVDVLRIGFNHPILQAWRQALRKGDRMASEVYWQKVIHFIFLAHLRGWEEDGHEMLDGHILTQRLIQLEQVLLKVLPKSS